MSLIKGLPRFHFAKACSTARPAGTEMATLSSPLQICPGTRANVAQRHARPTRNLRWPASISCLAAPSASIDSLLYCSPRPFFFLVECTAYIGLLVGMHSASTLLTIFGGRISDLRPFLLEERIPDGWESRIRSRFGLTFLVFNLTVFRVEFGTKEGVQGGAPAGASASPAAEAG